MGPDNLVRDVLKGLVRGEGLADDRTALGQALRAAGPGLWTTASAGCQGDHYTAPYQDINLFDYDKTISLLDAYPSLLSGCEASASTITGGDEETSRVVQAVVFSSQRRAEAGLEDLKGYLGGSGDLDVDVEDADIKDGLLVMKLTVYE